MKNFATKTIVIIVGMIILFVFNTVYLYRLHRNIMYEVEQNIVSIIKQTDNVELEMRTNALKKDSGTDMATVQIIGSVEQEDGKDILTIKRSATNIDYLHDSFEDKYEYNSITKDFKAKEQMSIMSGIQSSLHGAIDDLEPINLGVFDSIANAELENRLINARIVHIEVWKDDSLFLETVKLAGKPKSDYHKITYTYNVLNNSQYRIYTTPLNRDAFNQMIGIVITTFMILVLLIAAFAYLISTIIKQKTLEKMKSDFTSNMTHELKTPIAVAYSAVDAVRNFKLNNDEQKRQQYLDISLEQLSHLGGLVEHILNMSMERNRVFELKKEQFELAPLIEKQIELCKLKATKSVGFDVNINPANMNINADYTHISNVIANMLDNTVKYSYEKVHIKIVAHINQASAIIFIKDNGIGISQKNLPYIFDKFYRVGTGGKHNVKGYGLGLYYVKQIIEQHGGSISAQSNKSLSSEFKIIIPAR